MLTDNQKLTIKVAVGKAADKDAEVSKLAAGFKVPGTEIQAYWKEVSGAVMEPEKALRISEKVPVHKGRITWTLEMIRQLRDLHKSGATAKQIAKTMGIDVMQVKNKLNRMPEDAKPKPAAAHEKAKPVESVKPNAKIPTEPLKNGFSAAGFGVLKELWNLVEHFECTYSANITLLEASITAGWAMCSFNIDGSKYRLSLKEKRAAK